MTTYTAFRMIAYHVPTAHPLPAGDECTISDESTEAIKDNIADLSKDGLARLKRLISVVEAVAAANVAKKGVLNIFILPEFYFRPAAETEMTQGDAKYKTRAYSDKETFALIGALRNVFVADKRWRDWLFIFGSIIWHTDAKNLIIEAATLLTSEAKKLAESNTVPDQALSKTKTEQSSKLNEIAQTDIATTSFIVFNTGIVVTGGYGITVFDKFHYSDFDAIEKTFRASEPNSAYYYIITKWRAPLRDYLLDRRKLSSTSAIIPVGDNLLFGIEICLDHNLGILRQQWEKGNKPTLHFQVLTCCGMSVMADKVVVGKDGFVLRMDGSPIVAQSDPHSEIQRVCDFKNDKASTATQGGAKDVWEQDNKRVSFELKDQQLIDLKGVSWEAYDEATQQSVNTELKNVWQQQVFIYQDLPFAAFNQLN